MAISVYEIVTQQIMERLEKGEVPWKRPWSGSAGIPINLKSKKPYRGVNVWLLGCMGYSSPYWASFKQINDMGGHVKKGEKKTLVVFWKPPAGKVNRIDDEDEEETPKSSYRILRYYKVLNVEQTEGLEDKIPQVEKIEFNPIEKCEEIMEGMPQRPEIKYGGGRAFYRPDDDFVQLPLKEHFHSPEEFYSTAFHELVHSTGHNSRLSRDMKNFFGSHDYSKEELVAEMGASFLCGTAGIENTTIDNSAAYIQSWLKKLSNDKKMVVFAASAAQRAAEFILGKEE
jgi:antirestriction protein ArdC